MGFINEEHTLDIRVVLIDSLWNFFLELLNIDDNKFTHFPAK